MSMTSNERLINVQFNSYSTGELQEESIIKISIKFVLFRR